MRITESQLRRIVREQMQKSFQGFNAYNPHDSSQMIGVNTSAGAPPPRTISYSDFYGMFDSMGGAVLDDETMQQMYDDYVSGEIEWDQVVDAAMLD